MQKKAIAAVAVILLALGALSIVYVLHPTQATSLDFKAECSGLVNKKPEESFSVKITFKNKGTSRGTWKIAVTFEGDHWTWKGEEKQLTLKPDEKETLIWKGNVPEDATVDSIARLVVYYDDLFVPLNWWIHVTPGADLSIVDSKVS